MISRKTMMLRVSGRDYYAHADAASFRLEVEQVVNTGLYLCTTSLALKLTEPVRGDQ